MPKVTQRSSVDDGNAVLNSAVRLPRINDAKAFENEKSIAQAIYFHIAKDRRSRRFRLQTWRIKDRAKHFAALILNAISRIVSNPHSAHVEHDRVSLIFRIFNPAH